MFSIGDPANPQPSDPRFVTYHEAEVAAVARTLDDSQVLAVWQDGTGEVWALIFNGDVFFSLSTMGVELA